MAMETGFLQYAMELLKKDYARELKVLGVELPDVSQIPAVKLQISKKSIDREIQSQDEKSIRP